MTIGTNIYDFFIIPTIRIDIRESAFTRITIEWLKWYIGFAVDRKESEE